MVTVAVFFPLLAALVLRRPPGERTWLIPARGIPAVLLGLALAAVYLTLATAHRNAFTLPLGFASAAGFLALGVQEVAAWQRPPDENP